MDELRTALLGWYAQHMRELPWRQNTDAYRVWISEIMLQQTRVAAVLEHYRIFLEAFPTVQALAEGSEERVLTLWSGLGYYRRARMMHRAAQMVTSEMGGVIPQDAAGLMKLPGVGRYTAAAIASIAFGEPVAVVDGNVERVLRRMDGMDYEIASVWKRAQELLDGKRPGDWNQAMMELGATVCTPLSPQCLVCPVRAWCRAPGEGVRKVQAPRKRVRITRVLVERNDCVYVVQRGVGEKKMAGMWELPEWDGKEGEEPVFVVRHSITDTDYEVPVVRLELRELCAKDEMVGRWVRHAEIFALPLTGLTRKILRKLER